MKSRAELASEANALNLRSNRWRGQAPTLTVDSSRDDIARWLQWCDPNGTHIHETCTCERGGDGLQYDPLLILDYPSEMDRIAAEAHGDLRCRVCRWGSETGYEDAEEAWDALADMLKDDQ